MKKVMLVLLVLLGTIFLMIKGVEMNKVHQQNELIEMAHSKEAKEVYRRNIINIESEAFTTSGKIQNYTIDDQSIVKNPMGGILVSLIINDVKDYTVTVGLVYDSEKAMLRSPSTSYSKELVKFLQKGN